MVTIPVYVYREDTAGSKWYDYAESALEVNTDVQLSNVQFSVTEKESMVNFSSDGSSASEDHDDLILYVYDNDYYEGTGVIHLYVTDDYTDGVGQDEGADSSEDGFAVAGITDASNYEGYYRSIVIHEVLHNLGADHSDGDTINGCYTPMAIREGQYDECHLQDITNSTENTVDNYVASNY